MLDGRFARNLVNSDTAGFQPIPALFHVSLGGFSTSALKSADGVHPRRSCRERTDYPYICSVQSCSLDLHSAVTTFSVMCEALTLPSLGRARL